MKVVFYSTDKNLPNLKYTVWRQDINIRTVVGDIPECYSISINFIVWEVRLYWFPCSTRRGHILYISYISSVLQVAILG